MTTFLTADQHFCHANVMQYCNRKFANVDEMDEALITAWNSVVGKDDVVYHLGDFTLGGRIDAERLFLRLNGNIHVLSNPWHHDCRWIKYSGKYYSMNGIAEPVCIESPIVVLEDVIQNGNGRGVPAVLCHYAFEVWDRRHFGSLHFHAHSHSKLPIIANRLDVGVDEAFRLFGQYRPFELREAIDIAYHRENYEVNHDNSLD